MKHAVIYVFGLGDHRSRAQRAAVYLWRLQGIRSSTFRLHWREPGSFASKTQELVRQIDELHDQGYAVSLVGTSAGASAVMNIYATRQDVVHRVVCICGKVRNPQTVTTRRLVQNPAFGESLQLLPSSLGILSAEKLVRVLSVRPLVDHIVPPEDTVIDGAQHIHVPSIGHSFSIALCITIFSPRILGFIKRP